MEREGEIGSVNPQLQHLLQIPRTGICPYRDLQHLRIYLDDCRGANGDTGIH
jgi:hypothetical protein